jgi:two-component system NtrC family sensor kinase
MNILPIFTVKPMRLFLVMLFIFCGFFCSAQDFTDKGYWSELMPYNYLPIDSLWLFHPGDDLNAPVSNASGWVIANTGLLQNKIGKPLQMQGAGWYQKSFNVPVSLRDKPIALRMGHFGASEIFLDGKLIHRYGLVGNSIENEKIYVPRTAIIINLDSQASHKLLVHYSNFHANNPGYRNPHKGFWLLMSPPDIISQPWLAKFSDVPVSVGIIFIFSIYFFFVWLFYPKRLASLFTMFLLLDFSVLLTSIYFTLEESEWGPLVRASNTGAITASWLNFFLLLVLYALYYRGKMPGRSWFVVAGMLTCVIGVLNPRFAFLLGAASVLVYFDIIRMFILGIRNKVTGFWILLFGFLIQQAGFLFIVLDVFNWFPVYTPQLLLSQMIFPQLGIPLTFSLHLAWEFRSANRDLRLQLIQVNKLSEKSLEQEQEKQQLLASQNEMLEQQVEERTGELNASLNYLKSTQAQLIQSEKMASLGELTAGIAHEIQNPLNFVNNFSEVNREMVDEAVEEIDKENYTEVKNILNDIKDNSEKINHHGKRADAIVKGMLQHSRTSTGVKEPTDINALCDEYLRLSYHGLRAKDKDFNAIIKTDFDNSIGKINVIPQDIGRVLLNLFNNAFYAVNEKKNASTSSTEQPYEPTVTVSTKTVKPPSGGLGVLITVNDNGNGIPENIVDKIFQPFFTTKPTGEGTGLGLSLSYDIIMAHQGKIRVGNLAEQLNGSNGHDHVNEDGGTSFIIELPIG